MKAPKARNDTMQHQPAAIMAEYDKAMSADASISKAPAQRSVTPTHIEKSPRISAQRHTIQAAFGHTRQRPGDGPKDAMPAQRSGGAAGAAQRVNNPRQAAQFHQIALMRGAGGQGQEVDAVAHPLQKLSPLFGGADLSSIQLRERADVDMHGADAYAEGETITFRPGAFNPDSPRGLDLIGHEVAHVMQQRQGRVSGRQNKGGVDRDSALEAEADQVGARVARGEPAGLSANGTASGGVKQLRTYKQLSDTQQYQVDAIADDVYRMKAEAFEDQLGVVAGADARAQTAGNRILTGLAAANPGLAAQINPHINTAAQAQATFIGSNLALAPQANVAGAQSETWQEVGGPQAYPTAPGGVVEEDTSYATAARANHVVIRGGGSTPAARVFLTAQAQAANPAQLGETKVLALSLLAPPRAHSFHEVMLGALDVGLPYVPGLQGYRQIAPLTQPDVGLHFPDFFHSPEFLIQLAHYFFPSVAGEQAAAQAHFPANVLAHVQAINLQQAHDDAALQPLLTAGIARNLLDAIPAAQLAQLSIFVTANTIATHANWGAVQGDPVYTAVANAAGNRVAQLIFGHLAQAHHGGAGIHTFLSRAHGTLAGGPVVAPNNLFNAFDHAATLAAFNQNQGAYPNHDRDVDMNQTALDLVAANLSDDEATAINEYTGNHFANWHTLMGASGVTSPEQLLNGLPGDPARDRQVGAAEAALNGLRKLPVYGGPVFRGTNPNQGPLQNVGARNAAMAQFGVGNVVNPQIQLGAGFLSASKTIGDSFIGPTDFAFVIDNVQTGHDIQLLSGIPAEREVLFEPQARFVVTRVEDRLTPSLLVPNAFIGGQLYIYMKEISAAKSVAEANTRDQDFQSAYVQERDGRRLVDRAMYDQAQIAYHTEAAPTQDPQHRFATNWGAAGQMPQTQIRDDWSNAEQFMRTLVGNPLTAANIQQIHQRAGANLPGAQPGVFRGPGQNVFAGGGLDNNGQPAAGGLYSALTLAEIAALQGNNILVPQLAAIPALLLGQPQFAGGKTHLGLVQYQPGGNVAGLLTTWSNTYTAQFNVVHNMAPGAPKNQAAIQLAALAQKSFVSLHPFNDGNGRLSRLIMDHTLLSFGLAPALLADTNADTNSDDATWTQAVTAGVATTEALYREYTG